MVKRRVSVLVVDDEEVIRTILARIVTREGYLVTEATDGVDALAKMQTTGFDFVISDIKMPRMDGLDLLKEVRSLRPDTQVLLITGLGSEYNATDILAKGADFFITKPFKNVEIARVLNRLLVKSDRRKRLTAANPPQSSTALAAAGPAGSCPKPPKD